MRRGEGEAGEEKRLVDDDAEDRETGDAPSVARRQRCGVALAEQHIDDQGGDGDPQPGERERVEGVQTDLGNDVVEGEQHGDASHGAVQKERTGMLLQGPAIIIA